MHRSTGTLIALGVLFADQLSKLAATSWSWSAPVDWSNPGVGPISILPLGNGGVLGGTVVEQPELLPLVAVLALLVLIAQARRLTAGSHLGAALAAAGAAGNLMDRIRVGYVIDFLALDLGPAQAVLNLADVAIFIGLPMLVLAARFRVADKGKARAAPPPSKKRGLHPTLADRRMGRTC